MSRHCKQTTCLVPEGLLKEYFPYARMSPDGEYIIPKENLDEFVRKYNELADSQQHQERLAAYRAAGPVPGDNSDAS